VPSDRLFDIAGYIFPLFSVSQTPSELQVHRFLGTGFWIDRHGYFLTCKHVLEGVEEGQLPAIGQPFSGKPDYYIPVLQSTAHARFDIAVGRAPESKVSGVLRIYSGIFGLGVDVQAFGFTDAGKVGNHFQLDVRLLRGYVSRHSDDALGLPSPSLLEVSFGSPSGFSGTPLLVNTEVVGVLYRNVESKLESYSVSETVDSKTEFREVAYRIYEYGVAHRFAELVPFLKDCGASI